MAKNEKGEYRMSSFGQPKESAEFSKPGEIESIRIEPGQNGFSVNVRRKPFPVKGKKGDGDMISPSYDYREPKPKFYSDVAGVLGCIKEELGESPGQEVAEHK